MRGAGGAALSLHAHTFNQPDILKRPSVAGPCTRRRTKKLPQQRARTVSLSRYSFLWSVRPCCGSPSSVYTMASLPESHVKRRGPWRPCQVSGTLRRQRNQCVVQEGPKESPTDAGTNSCLPASANEGLGAPGGGGGSGRHGEEGGRACGVGIWGHGGMDGGLSGPWRAVIISVTSPACLSRRSRR
jgi:hypothetical protein